jgi:hypothetical protein
MTRRMLWPGMALAAAILSGCAIVPLDGPYHGNAYVRGDSGHHRHPYPRHWSGHRGHIRPPWAHRGW